MKQLIQEILKKSYKPLEGSFFLIPTDKEMSPSKFVIKSMYLKDVVQKDLFSLHKLQWNSLIVPYLIKLYGLSGKEETELKAFLELDEDAFIFGFPFARGIVDFYLNNDIKKTIKQVNIRLPKELNEPQFISQIKVDFSLGGVDPEIETDGFDSYGSNKEKLGALKEYLQGKRKKIEPKPLPKDLGPTLPPIKPFASKIAANKTKEQVAKEHKMDPNDDDFEINYGHEVTKKSYSEKLIKDILKEASAGGGSHSQTGDTARFLREQGFLNDEEFATLSGRDEAAPGHGNSIDTRQLFEKQNPI